MKILSAVAAMVLFFAVGATAETTNTLSDAEIQGRALAQKILEQRPATNYDQTGVFRIFDRKNRAEIPLRIKVAFEGLSSWSTTYETISKSNIFVLSVTHIVLNDDRQDIYLLFPGNHTLIGNQTMIPFANSDFWLCDLGLEFFHWPSQKVLKQEVHRSCGCTVLESTNPDPSTNGYSRVISWIDTDSLGIVEANTYDARGKLLKNFYPKDLKKINGQYQVQTMVMKNVQTGSTTRLEFDLKK